MAAASSFTALASGRTRLLLRQRRNADRRKLLVKRGENFGSDVVGGIAGQGGALADDDLALASRPNLLGNHDDTTAELLLDIRLDRLELAFLLGEFSLSLLAAGLILGDPSLERRVGLLSGKGGDRRPECSFFGLPLRRKLLRACPGSRQLTLKTGTRGLASGSFT